MLRQSASRSHLLIALGIILLGGWLIQASWRGGSPGIGVRAEENSPRPSGNFQYNGEYGLWVENSSGQLIIHWLTARTDSGFLKVILDNRVLEALKTPQAFAHQAAFAGDWEQKSELTLQYGSLADETDRHTTIIYPPAAGANRQFEYENVDSVFVIGDIHGRYDQLVQLLTNAGLIDRRLSWRSGGAHLVCLGDVFDRGYDVIKTLWFLYRLEREAERGGGKVHVILGNHEIMVFLDDLRYTSQKEKIIAKYHQTDYATMFDPHTSVLGKWLASKPGMIKINNALYAHGGVAPYFAQFSIRSFNDSLYRYLQEPEFTMLLEEGRETIGGDSLRYRRMAQFFFAENSVFWYRGYTLADTLEKELNHVLKQYNSKLHVTAHTALTTIEKRYKGKLFAVDLQDAATEMLLLAYSKRNKYKAFRYTLEGAPRPL